MTRSSSEAREVMERRRRESRCDEEIVGDIDGGLQHKRNRFLGQKSMKEQGGEKSAVTNFTHAYLLWEKGGEEE